MSYWIFQANPKRYDIDAALTELSEIRWRVPQYTGQISAGDNVLIWRSGKNAGVVGLGTVRSGPSAQPVPEAENQFVLSDAYEGSTATRVSLAVRPVDLMPKTRWKEHAALRDLKIVTAPMETVFPLTRTEWDLVISLGGFPAPPAMAADEGVSDTVPNVFAWADRGKDAYPLPGGYSGQIESLKYILEYCHDQRPDRAGLEAAIRDQFGSSENNARFMTNYLRRIGFLIETSGHVTASQPLLDAVERGDSDIVLATMHSRVRFFGEMMEFLRSPHSSDQILDYANDSFGMGWSTKAQIQRRRGWMESAGAIEITDSKDLTLTKAGVRLLDSLELKPPIPSSESPGPQIQPGPEPVTAEPSTVDEIDTDGNEVQALASRVKSTSVDSANPDDFEEAIAEVFSFLGFRADKLGGAGKTDVVADAELALGTSYRVIIDGKTTAKGLVADGQIDWDTLDDHRTQHKADYVVVAGPGFRGERLFNRAEAHNVLLLTAGDLVDLVRQHAHSPMGVDDYRALFENNRGEADLVALAEVADAGERMLEVASAILTAVEDEADEVGPLSARDLFLLLRGSSEFEASESEISEAAQALASPFVQLLRHDDGCFRLAGPRRTARRRLQLMADRFAP